MTPRIALALTLHNHQPVGNFGWVIAETYERAYEPMIAALERHPGIRVALHYTGPLLAWLRAERPDFVARLRTLAGRGQIELVGGGWYEPVLAALPERDRVEQLVRMADELEATFGRRPRGAWLAERVWEPDVPTALVAAGYEWTVLDDAHFRAAAIPEDDLWGSYTTDDQGKVVTVFGTEQGLRYRIPFAEVEDVISYLRDHATVEGERLGTMGDDGEKFGAWPTTWEHCWGPGRWVERFFEALDANAAWLTTMPPSDWITAHRPVGRVYLPTGSYAEMGEWALPPDEAIAYAEALHRARDEGRPEARWLRGAIWRNFQVRYREINDLHKQMLRTSGLVHAMPPGAARDAALDDLHAGQSNDPYWHGLFGGIYLPDLRVANLRHLIRAEDRALRSAAGGDDGPAAATLVDLDLDGRDEVLLVDEGQIVSIKPDDGAGIGRWDVRAPAVPLAAVMRRRPEAYHAKVRAYDALLGHGDRAGAGDDRGSDAAPGATTSIHDLVLVKQAGLSERLQYDRHERRSGLVRLLPVPAPVEAWADGTVDDLVPAVDGAWTVDALVPGCVTTSFRRDGIRLTRTVQLGGDRAAPALAIEVRVANDGPAPVEARLGLEFGLMLLGGGHNPGAWWEVGDERFAHDDRRRATGIERLGSGNTALGVQIATTVDGPADAWIEPIETVSNSEAGFELVYQGSALLISRLVTIAPGASASLAVSHSVTTAPDRA
ncbi:MAG TPA: alpha-amylase/4-alpha-glucanotransferase domain-containing protein [Candidatus Limnocylindrales bacterium]|nr:alpha-amylase/4-alpha-glucanotransferase domain-containing protein [Candidatus Limnocylindrales bacterium]